MVHITEEMALEYHRAPRPGKTEVVPTKPYSSQQDLALAYSPGVAYPCLAIKENGGDVYSYTNKGNLVAVISNCTAVLGLGDIGPEAGKPVMEGKALLFKIFAGLDCFDIEVAEKDPEKFIQVVKAIAPTFGGINLEDIKAPEAFEIERRLKEELDIPVMHDDQHGTAIISAAGLLNALELQGKRIADVKLVVNGAGAAAISCTRLYMALGIRRENIVMCDSKGVISDRRESISPEKKEFATSRTDVSTLAEALKGADVFLGLSVADVLTADMLRSMAPRPIVFALANPNPEIDYNLAIRSRHDMIFATGRSDYPNQINNVLGFPYIFRGALDSGASVINEEMKLAAVHAIADLAKKPVPALVNAAYDMKGLRFGPEYILPKPLDPRLLTAVAPAVARAAIDSGVARRKISDWKRYELDLRTRMGFENKLMMNLIDEAKSQPAKRVVLGEGNTDNMLRAAASVVRQGIGIPVLLGNEEMIARRAERLGLSLDGMEIINPRHDREARRRERFAKLYSCRNSRRGVTFDQALEKMFDRNYFGMMMVETRDADAFIAGTYSGGHEAAEIAKSVIGIREAYSHFASVHILNTKRGIYFLADTMINECADENTLYDVARLARNTAEYFAREPVIAMVSYSNFGSNSHDECNKVSRVVARLHKEYPDLPVDGEMQVHYALNSALRDEKYPFNRLHGKEVNTLVFPNLSSANTTLRMMLEMGVGEAIGPIQVGLRKPVHFINVDTDPRDIVNLFTIAVLDAGVCHAVAKGESRYVDK